MLIVWDVESGKSLYGTPIKDVVHEVAFFNNTDSKLVAVLQNGVQILTIDKNNKKVLTSLNEDSLHRCQLWQYQALLHMLCNRSQ